MSKKCNRLVATLLAIFMMVSFMGISASAAEPSVEDIQKNSVVFNNENGIQPLGEFTTFLNFKAGVLTGTQTYNFHLGKACVLKTALNCRYVDHSSGSIQVTIINTSTSQTFSLTFSTSNTQTVTQEFNGGRSVPAGNYVVYVSPSNENKQYIASGYIYCSNY